MGFDSFAFKLLRYVTFKNIAVFILLILSIIIGSKALLFFGEVTQRQTVTGAIQTTSQIRSDSDGVPTEKLFVTVLPSNGAPVTMQFRDSLPNGVFNSRDHHAVAEHNKGKTCTVKGAGFTFRPASIVPAVTDITCNPQ
jgi:hypothetical protein